MKDSGMENMYVDEYDGVFGYDTSKEVMDVLFKSG